MQQSDDAVQRARSKWANRGAARPSFADPTAPGQESVWDYPRPPALVPDPREVIIGDLDDPIARTTRAMRVLETASPPTIYVPLADIDASRLHVVAGSSMCEWKGLARYWALIDSDQPIGWDYPEPFEEFSDLRDHLAFYPGRVPCWLGGERVRPQDGGFYGGWVTDEIVGPWKGQPGTGSW